MRAIIYAALAEEGKVDLDTVLFDRQVEPDIAACHAGPKPDASWDDYRPVALIEVPGGTFRKEDRNLLLCWKGVEGRDLLDRLRYVALGDEDFSQFHSSPRKPRRRAQHCIARTWEPQGYIPTARPPQALPAARLPCYDFRAWHDTRLRERWPSGLRRRSRKPVWEQSHRGFESHPLRHGEMPEWPIGRDWKSRVAARRPWVRIPLSPPPPVRIGTPPAWRVGDDDGTTETARLRRGRGIERRRHGLQGRVLADGRRPAGQHARARYARTSSRRAWSTASSPCPASYSARPRYPPASGSCPLPLVSCPRRAVREPPLRGNGGPSEIPCSWTPARWAT